MTRPDTSVRPVPASRHLVWSSSRGRHTIIRVAFGLVTAGLLGNGQAADGLFGNSKLGTGVRNEVQPINSNTEVGTTLLGTTLDSTITDPRATPNQDMPPLPPRERGTIAEERSGRTDMPARAQPLMR